MSRLRKLSLLVLVALLIGLCWYLFIKDYNYRITFKTPHAPGTVYSALSEMRALKTDDVDSIYVSDKKPFEFIAFNMHYGDSVFNINWKIKRVNDSLTRLTGSIKDLKNSLKQNILIPFKQTDFIKRNVKLSYGLMNGLLDHKEEYKVSLASDSIVKVPSQYCAYISLESDIYQKATTMMSNISLIMSYIKGNEIPITGDPFVKVREWDVKSSKIKYDFCFPIKKPDSLPPTKTIKFRNTEEFMALKAIFNGNYRLSDRAWYELIDLAEQRGIEVDPRPFEIYRNDPHSGGNELEWIAEVYLPVKE